MDNLSPNISILMDDAEYANIYENLKHVKTEMRKLNDIMAEEKKKIDNAIFRILAKLSTNEKALTMLEEHMPTEIELYSPDRLKDYVENNNYSLSYDITDKDDGIIMVSDEYEYDIISFPLSFLYRADWLANFEIFDEASKLSEENERKSIEEHKKTEEIKLLKELLIKYKDSL